MPKVQREKLFLKWATKNKRDGIGSKAANSEISLVKVRNIIGGHEGSGLFRSGSTGEGVVLLQVKLDWNPKFKKNGKIYKLLIVDTFGSKTNSQLSGWFWTMCSYQIFKCY